MVVQINTAAAASLIRTIVANEIKLNQKAKGLSTPYRKWIGTTRSQISKKQILLGNDGNGIARASGKYKDDAFVCYWILTNQPTTSRDIYIQQGMGIVLGAVSGLADAGVFGSTIGKIGKIKSDIDQGARAGSLKGAVSNINAQLNAAWRAGMMDGAIGTKQEFSIRSPEAHMRGCAAISGHGKKLKVRMRLFETHKELVDDIRVKGDNYGLDTQKCFHQIRDCCNALTWEFSEDSGQIVKVK